MSHIVQKNLGEYARKFLICIALGFN